MCLKKKNLIIKNICSQIFKINYFYRILYIGLNEI